MVNVIHQALVADIEAALSQANMSKSQFGKIAVNDPCLVYDLENGRELRMSTQARVQKAIADLNGVPLSESGTP